MIDIPQHIAEREFGLTNIAREHANLEKLITQHFGQRVWFMTDACMSVIASLALKDLPNPIGLNLVDGPSSEKTTVLSFFYDLPQVYRSDDFTPASFVSQAANKSEKKLEEVDLLPRIRHKCLVVPELAPIYGADKEELLKNFSILVRVFDGEGYWRDGATHGRRGYEGDYHFAWLGATTPIKPHVWKLMGHLGSRFLFLTAESEIGCEEEIEQVANALLAETSYREKVSICKEVVTKFFQCVVAASGGKNIYRSVEWNRQGEDRRLIKQLSKLAQLTARIRSTISVWGTEGTGHNREIDFTIPIREYPMRLASVLYGLARSHALICGRSKVTEEELPLIVAVALSSIPDDRRRVLNLMIDTDHPDKSSERGSVTSTEIEEILGFSRPTARKVLQTLRVLEVGSLENSVGPVPAKLTLKDHYDWLKTDDFIQYRQVWSQVSDPSSKVPF